MKKSAKVLHYFGLDCGMLEFLQIFFSQAVIQRTIAEFPAFFETGLAKKISVCVHATRVPNKKEDKRHICMKWLRTLNSLKGPVLPVQCIYPAPSWVLLFKLKNQKPIAVDILFKAYPFIPLSG